MWQSKSVGRIFKVSPFYQFTNTTDTSKMSKILKNESIRKIYKIKVCFCENNTWAAIANVWPSSPEAKSFPESLKSVRPRRPSCCCCCCCWSRFRPPIFGSFQFLKKLLSRFLSFEPCQRFIIITRAQNIVSSTVESKQSHIQAVLRGDLESGRSSEIA